ncbi:TIGR04066 family peptide maturation system protein [Clostridium beijerinckii]|uniref:TIGR04066 family peptide maturation system protein n=1 Tax=Clostridium beijerinckii TaxID=1520 RepID=UPI00156FCA2D|nr:TIGR04066 family peptide maturation system protein [Clostridium beijerinckii]NRT74800.1 peptide maturation system protein (TIGR04066 family) [Clostridium beijerinckii]
MKKKVLIYPFSNKFFPVIKAIINREDEYEIVSAVTPKTWFLARENDDVSKINNSDPLGIIISNNFEEEIKKCNTVIIADCNNEKIIYRDIVNKIKVSIEFNKNIICCFKLEDKDILEINELCQNSNLKFEYLNEPDESYEAIDIFKKQIANNYTKIYKPDSTVIFVGKLLDELESAFSLVSISENYKKEGYNVVTISLNNNCKIMGYISFPSFIFESNTSIEEKIFLFNCFIDKIEKKHRPDVIIVELPGGMLKYSDIITNGFGVYPYLISQAISNDYFVLVTPFDEIDEEYYEKLSECFWYRFGFKIDVVNMLNATLDTAYSIEQRKVILNYLPIQNVNKIISKKFENSKISVLNPLNNIDCEKMFRESLSTLTKYVSIV